MFSHACTNRSQSHIRIMFPDVSLCQTNFTSKVRTVVIIYLSVSSSGTPYIVCFY